MVLLLLIENKCSVTYTTKETGDKGWIFDPNQADMINVSLISILIIVLIILLLISRKKGYSSLFSIIMPLVYFQLIYLIPLMNFRGPLIFYSFWSYFSFAKLDFYYFFVKIMGINPDLFGPININQYINLKAIGYSSGSTLYNHIFLIIIWVGLASWASAIKLFTKLKWFNKSKGKQKLKVWFQYFSKPSIFILILVGSAQFLLIASLSEILSLNFNGGILSLFSFIFSWIILFVMTAGSVLITISGKLQKFSGYDELKQSKSSRRIYLLFFLQKLMIWWIFIVTTRGFFQIPFFVLLNGVGSWYMLNIKPFLKMRENFVLGSNFWVVGLACLGLTKFADLSELQAPKEGEHNGEGLLLIALFSVHITIIALVFIVGDVIQFIREKRKKRGRISRYYKENEEHSENYDLTKKNEDVKEEDEINLPLDPIMKKLGRSDSNWDIQSQVPKRLSNVSNNFLRKSKDSKKSSDKETESISSKNKSKKRMTIANKLDDIEGVTKDIRSSIKLSKSDIKSNENNIYSKDRKRFSQNIIINSSDWKSDNALSNIPYQQFNQENPELNQTYEKSNNLNNIQNAPEIDNHNLQGITQEENQELPLYPALPITKKESFEKIDVKNNQIIHNNEDNKAKNVEIIQKESEIYSPEVKNNNSLIDENREYKNSDHKDSNLLQENEEKVEMSITKTENNKFEKYNEEAEENTIIGNHLFSLI